jgi:hypothetical protein
VRKRSLEIVIPLENPDRAIRGPLRIDFHRTLIDPATCQTFTEVIATDKSHSYVIGARLRVNGDKIAEIESLVTDSGDWLFDADNYLE